MRWAIQSTLINPIHSVQVLEAVKALGKSFILADHIPFDDKFIEEPVGTDFIPYGSTTVLKMALARKWEGLAFDPETFQHSVWVKERADMLNQAAVHWTIKQTTEEAGLYRPDIEWFIRPNGDLKQFAGFVDTVDNIHTWLTKAVDSSIGSFSPDDIVAVSPPKTIHAEWRCFVIGDNVIDSSMYRCNAQPRLEHEKNPALKQQFKRMALDWTPHQNCVMDVALTDEGFKVVEFNSINSSGFYDHDIPLIIQVLDKAYDR